jgi:ketosteroid isomerase-like protein
MKADSSTEKAIVGMLREWSDSFSAKDLEGILALFAPDADVTMLGSEDWEMGVGPDALRAVYTRLFTRGDSATWEWKWHQISSSGSAAWMLATGIVHVNNGADEISGPYRLSAVFERQGEGWVWMQFHGSEPAKTSENEPGRAAGIVTLRGSPTQDPNHAIIRANAVITRATPGP